MLYAQLSGKKSLRDLVFSLGRHRQKLYHLGITRPVKRSSLADANKQRPVLIFAQTYFKLLQRLESELGRQPGHHRVKIMDATYVPVCDSLFPWADFMPGNSAVKLHFLLDADAGTPQDLQVTSGQVHELEVARQLSFTPGDLLLLDRGYVDFAWLYSLHQQGVGFVTRLPRHIRYRVVQGNPHLLTPRSRPIKPSGLPPSAAAAAIPSPCAWCGIGTRKPAKNMCFSPTCRTCPPWRWPTSIGSVGRSRPFSGGLSKT